MGGRAIRAGAGAIALTTMAALGLPGVAAAKRQANPEFVPFVNCPIQTKAVRYCIVATTTSGEFKVGSKTVTIDKPIVLQGGLTEGSEALVGASDGETLSHTSLTVPGGLVGVEGVGGEVTATTELAGPVLVNEVNLSTGEGAAVTLPIVVKLENPALGDECLIGSEGEPIVLKLTTGTTSPPAPNTPIHGNRGTLTINEAQSIFTLTENSLVDNSFAAPGVSGCGEALAPVLDPVVDLSAGLPAAAGTNTAILNGTVQETTAYALKHAHVITKAKGSRS
ncbi:MAG TPA: hypothetical protein VL972_02100 [Solirubrobacteraceae bacterium]|nr:hypothetical protein [Solirubrobacteraceae bacterium]